ncbi:MAG: hypothetical protein GY775_09685 [Candidatus Scalindua sp.]|nr:hypothetical protein [Candidatus Scalindua sp.]
MIKTKLHDTVIKVIILTCAFSVIGCQYISKVSRPMVGLGIVENTTNTELKNVNVMHLPTRASVSTSGILPHQKLVLGFEPTELRGETAIVSWYGNGQMYKVTLDVPKMQVYDKADIMTLVYRLHTGGRVTAHLIAGQYP